MYLLPWKNGDTKLKKKKKKTLTTMRIYIFAETEMNSVLLQLIMSC